jgi:ribonucleoside-diphosphate reductase alpha chain
MKVTKKNGSLEPRDDTKIQKQTSWMCKGLNVSQSELEVNIAAKFYDGIPTSKIEEAVIISGGELISEEYPDYKFATARALLQKIYKEVTGGSISYGHLADYIELGVDEKQLDPRLLDFNLHLLNSEIKVERDLQFDYLGLQTVADRYLVREMSPDPEHPGKVIELPQHFFMRVAMGLALRDVEVKGLAADSEQVTEDALSFYELLSSFDYMTSTPTLFNAGTTHAQLSSCYLNTVPDTLYCDHDEKAGHHFASIYGTIEECARLSKYAGGIGTDWNRVRPEGSLIKGTNGKSAGTVPYIKVWNDTAVAVNQGGKRNGAFAAYMEPWHPDFIAFCELRKNSGEERRRAHEIFPAAWVPDLLMKREAEGGVWSFFAPDEHPDLHELFGAEFEVRYEQLEREGKFRSQMPAKDLWRKMMTMLFETGHPWITFKDECNRRNPQQHVGIVHSSNLCTEITLNTNDDETAVCNLGSINAARHVVNGLIDHVKLRKTIRVAMRALDNVVDINFYPSSRAKNSNMQHRPVGLGLMGLTDMMCQMGIDWESQESLDMQDELFEAISYHGISASSDLAVERGVYPSYEGSLWSKGVLPIHTANENAIALTAHRAHCYDWAELTNRVMLQGMRNSNIMAIAPTATIANITGVVPSIESPFELSYTKSNLSGQFLVVTSALQYGHPVKAAFDVEQLWSIMAAGVRQKWICQSQSLNLFVPADIKGSKLSGLYKKARFYGCKTTYYLRRKVVETEDAGAPEVLRQAEVEPEVKFCSISDPSCESCQ